MIVFQQMWHFFYDIKFFEYLVVLYFQFCVDIFQFQLTMWVLVLLIY